MPEMNQENNFNIENNMTPTVPVEPVNPVVNVTQEPVVEIAPTVEIPVVEVVEETAAQTPVVEVAPVEIVPEVTTAAPVMVNEIPEVLPVNNDVVVEESVVTITPNTQIVAETPVASINVEPVSVVNETAAEELLDSMDDMPVIETAPAVEETPVVSETPVVENSNEVVSEVAPVAPTAPVVEETPATPAAEENTIINSVVSDVTPTATPEVAPSTPDASEAKPEKKGTLKVILFILLGVAALVVGVVLAFYFFVYTKPQYLFKTSLDVLKNKISETTSSSDGPMQVDLSFQTNINSNDEMFKPIFENINKLYFETSIYLDLQNKIEFMKLDTKYKDQALLSADMFVEKENAFVKLNGIFDKYIKVILEEDIFKEESTDSNATIVAEGIINAVDVSLKNEYFTKVEKTASLNNMVKKVTANTLVINGENVVPFITDVVNTLKADEEFLVAYSEMQGITNDEFVLELDKFLKDIKETSQEVLNTINYQLTFYTEGILNAVVGLGVVYENVSYDLYFVDGSVSVYTTADNSTELLLEANQKDGKYVVNAYIGEDTYSVTVGFAVNENPTFTKPNVSSYVDADKLTEEDSMTILGGLMQSPGVATFMTDFQDVITLIQMMMGGGMTQPDTDLDVDFNDSTIYLE